MVFATRGALYAARANFFSAPYSWTCGCILHAVGFPSHGCPCHPLQLLCFCLLFDPGPLPRCHLPWEYGLRRGHNDHSNLVATGEGDLLHGLRQSMGARYPVPSYIGVALVGAVVFVAYWYFLGAVLPVKAIVKVAHKAEPTSHRHPLTKKVMVLTAPM